MCSVKPVRDLKHYSFEKILKVKCANNFFFKALGGSYKKNTLLKAVAEHSGLSAFRKFSKCQTSLFGRIKIFIRLIMKELNKEKESI